MVVRSLLTEIKQPIFISRMLLRVLVRSQIWCPSTTMLTMRKVGGEVLQRDTKSSLTHLTQKSRCLHPLHILHERTNERTLFLSFYPGTYQARRKGYLSFNFIYRCCDKVRTRNQINEDSPCREGYLPSGKRQTKLLLQIVAAACARKEWFVLFGIF